MSQLNLWLKHHLKWLNSGLKRQYIWLNSDSTQLQILRTDSTLTQLAPNSVCERGGRFNQHKTNSTGPSALGQGGTVNLALMESQLVYQLNNGATATRIYEFCSSIFAPFHKNFGKM